MNKYHAKRTYSHLVDRTFDSKQECNRAEELHLLERAGEISDLQYQVPFVLSKKPSVKVIIDFTYKDGDSIIYEDSKGVLTSTARVKYAWLKDKYGIEVLLTGRNR